MEQLVVTPMDQSASVEFMEGFLCPICVIDFKSPVNLSAHFEDTHADDKIVQQFKSVLDKAKRKLRKEEPSSDGIVNELSTEHIDGGASTVSASSISVDHGLAERPGRVVLWEKQKLGTVTSLTQEFSDLRKVAIEGMVVETNRLIIRLEKLVKSGIYAAAPAPALGLFTRRAKEKSVIPWENDSNTKNCINCEMKFSLTNRRHHCRLCGKVVCRECMVRLDATVVSGVLKLDHAMSSQYISTDDNDNNESGLRVCFLCSNLLDRQHKLIKDEQANDGMLLLYDKLKATMNDANALQPKYMKMAESLNLGETEFHLEVATETRVQLLKLYESIDTLSKRILNLGMNDTEGVGVSPQLLKLQKYVRMYASNYLAENMFILPALPTSEKLEEMSTKKKTVTPKDSISQSTWNEKQQQPQHQSLSFTPKHQTQRNGEKQYEYESQLKSNTLSNVGKASSNSSISSMDSSKSQNSGDRTNRSRGSSKETRPAIQAVTISKTEGSSWGPVQPQIGHQVVSVIDEQIQIVRGYLAQARQAGKRDEVALFEENLRE